MNTIVLDKKNYVVVAQKEYDKLIAKAAVKTPSARKMSLSEAKKTAYSLIDKWHSEK
jgi:ribosomal protein L15